MDELKFYKCSVCGNIIVMIEKSGVPVHCCGKRMEEIRPNRQDASHEKHVPVVEIFRNQVLVSIGDAPHPMLDDHYIEWIVFQSETGFQIHYLQPGDPPCYEFHIQDKVIPINAFAYCNLHGLWELPIK